MVSSPAERKENDPLLPRSSSNGKNKSDKSDSVLLENSNKTKRKNRAVLSVAALLLVFLVGTLAVFKIRSTPSLDASTTSLSIIERARAAKSRVAIDPETGIYSVDFESSGTATSSTSTSSTSSSTESTTFSELAEIMILPWYEASMMAVLDDPAWKDNKKKGEGGIAPDNVYNVREVFLITRDMLDVFSPVFPDTPIGKRTFSKKDRSLWKKLRTEYKIGYEKMGELHDLLKVTYSQKLLDERVNAVLDWKSDFVAFQKAHRIRRFLYGGKGIDATLGGKHYHEASHLFWSDASYEDLPSGNDGGIASLHKIGSVQLQNSLNYLSTIESYETALPEEHEINFHNLRKQLRIFVDEYKLFGGFLVPPPASTTTTNGTVASEGSANDTDDDKIDERFPPGINLLHEAELKLGAVNDLWTARDIYVRNDSHPEQQEKLAMKADKDLRKFLDWQARHDLRGCMEGILESMNVDTNADDEESGSVFE